MNFEEYYISASSAFIENGLPNLLTKEKAKKLFDFSNFLIETNKITNLTAILDESEILLKHIIDSATVSPFIESNSHLIDIGCGAGFPSIPLAILRDDIQITALDSTGKKIDFVLAAANMLQLNNLTAVCARAEEFVSDHREAFDVSVSRAVSRLNILSELSLPLVKVGGKFIAMKSNKGKEEYDESKSGISILGGRLASVSEHSLSYGNISISRGIYIFEKKSHSPANYPRKYAQILKKPL